MQFKYWAADIIAQNIIARKVVTRKIDTKWRNLPLYLLNIPFSILIADELNNFLLKELSLGHNFLIPISLQPEDVNLWYFKQLD